jgi:hypothetical protein
MNRTCIKIDLIALRARLSREQRCDVDLAEVTHWLVQGGFTHNGDWHCDSRAIHLLRPNEILASRHLEDEHGIVFVD